MSLDTYIRVCVCVYILVCVCVCVCVYIYIYVCVCIYIYIYIYICVCIICNTSYMCIYRSIVRFEIYERVGFSAIFGILIFSKSKKRIFVFPQKTSYTWPSILKMSPLTSAFALDFSRIFNIFLRNLNLSIDIW